MKSTYPPYLDQVHEHCPKASAIYTKFWREKDQDLKVFYPKAKITEEELIPWNTFRTNLKLLKKEKVLKFSIDSENNVTITLSDPQYS